MLVSSLARVAASVIRSTNSCVLAWAKGPFEIYEQGRGLIMPFALMLNQRFSAYRVSPS
jgi:hypothetical protein